MAEPILIPQTEALLAEFKRSGLRELHVRTPDYEIFLSNDPTIRPRLQPGSASSAPVAAASAPPPTRTPAPVAPPAQPRPATDLPADAIIVRAPNLGTFYGAPKPGAEAYVLVGSDVKAGAEICLIEVMKLFTTVRAEVDGRIHAILAADGEMVEAGQPLFAIVRT